MEVLGKVAFDAGSGFWMVLQFKKALCDWTHEIVSDGGVYRSAPECGNSHEAFKVFGCLSRFSCEARNISWLLDREE